VIARPGHLRFLVVWVLCGRPAEGLVDVPAPPARPSVSRAEALYGRLCQDCHGEHGVRLQQGGPAGVRLPSFGDPDWLRAQVPAEVFELVRTGHGGHLPAPPAGLTLQEAWDVASFVWSFGRAPAQVEDGRRLFAIHCADCHGPAGDGIGASIEERPTTSSDFSLVGTLAADSDADVIAVLNDGMPEFGMPPFESRLSDSDRQALVGFLRALPFSEVYFASATGRQASWRSPQFGHRPQPGVDPGAASDRRSFGWLSVAVGTLLGGLFVWGALRMQQRP
jgi:mono/diheme cytochrome c family protein